MPITAQIATDPSYKTRNAYLLLELPDGSQYQTQLEVENIVSADRYCLRTFGESAMAVIKDAVAEMVAMNDRVIRVPAEVGQYVAFEIARDQAVARLAKLDTVLVQLRGQVEHWNDDVAAGLLPTASSLKDTLVGISAAIPLASMEADRDAKFSGRAA